MKELKRTSLDELRNEMQVLRKDEAMKCIGGGDPLKNGIVIEVVRNGYGNDSTLSSFVAYAYDASGNICDEMRGFFLEPKVDSEREEVAGSDTAIGSGTYTVVKTTHHGESGYYGLEGVDGRSGINIHPGNTGKDTEGCLLPGGTGSYDEKTGEFKVEGSRDKWNELNSFFDQYGEKGIQMNINNGEDQYRKEDDYE